MIKISRFGAAALAIALSVSFIIAPASTVEAKTWGQGYTTNDNVDPIDTLQTKVAISGSAANTGNTANALVSDAALARINALNDAKAKGVLTDGTILNYDFSAPDPSDTTGSKTLYWKFTPGYSRISWKKQGTLENNNYVYEGSAIYTVYKNYVTGATSNNERDLWSNGHKADIYGVNDRYVVYKDDYVDIPVALRRGDTQIKNLKSSKKKIVQVKIADSDVTTTTETFEVTSQDEKGYYYFYNDTREEDKIYQPKETKINESEADITIRIYAKKVGKSVVSFDVYNKDGAKTGSVKFTVSATDKTPFESVTFNGKSLIRTNKVGAADSKYMYAGKDVDSMFAYITTKKAGKFKIVPNEGVRIEKILVGSLKANTTTYNPTDYEDYNSNNYDTADVTKTKAWTEITTNGYGADLNGDGDKLDTVNGVSESSVNFIYNKEVKNGKKISLSKVPYYTTRTSTDSTTNKADPTASTSTVKNRSNKAGAYDAPTSIKVIFYNRETRSYGTAYFTIWKKIAKF